MSSETENLFGRCRCCLKEGQHKDITKPYYTDADRAREVYREIILECFNISLSSNMKLTNLICASCIRQLKEAYKFKAMVTESEQKLLQEIGSNDPVTRLHPELEIDFQHEVTVKQEPQNLKFEHIVVKVEPRHFSESYDGAGGDNDPPPPIEFEFDNNAAGHRMGNSFVNTNNHNSINIMIEPETDANNERKPDINKLLIKRQANNKYSCTNKESLLKSYLQTASAPRPYMCDTCSYSAITKPQLERHIKRNHLEKPHACEVCNKSFYFKSNFLIHTRIHTGERPHACEICNQRFAQRSHLKYHSRIHLTERPFACDICDKKFTQESNLHDHRRIHTGDKPFSCKTCHKKFARSNTLARHVRIHTDVKPYTCEVCKKRFSQTGHLIQHARIHSGEKPFACDICDKRFARKGHLSDHFKSHTDVKTYTCPTCNGKFKRQGALSRHIRRHANKPNTCKILEVDIKQEHIEVELNNESLDNIKKERLEKGKNTDGSEVDRNKRSLDIEIKKEVLDD